MKKSKDFNPAYNKKRNLFIAQFSVLLAIEIIFCFTPLGSLPAIGPIVATLAMIPVVITAVMLGTAAGTLMGAFAGLFSFIVWTFMPPPLSVHMAFVFTPFYSLGGFQGNFGSVLICFVPRILVGTVSGLSYRALSRKLSAKGIQSILSFSVSAILGSLVNTFGVMGGIWLFFGQQYASLDPDGRSILILIGLTILTSGLPEAAVSAIACSAVCKPLKTVLARSGAKTAVKANVQTDVQADKTDMKND